MNLGGQEYEEKNDKVKKIIKISIIVAVIALFIVLAVYMYIYYMDLKTLKMSVDNKNVTISNDMFVIDETGKVYVSIKDFSSAVGYEYYQGDYGKYTEDSSKCYLVNKNEVAGFELGSNKLYKLDPTETSPNYEWYEIKEPVKVLNGKLYCISDAIKTACNLKFNYNSEKNRIRVTTLEKLVSAYQEVAISKYGYAGIDTTYANEKALLYNMMVIKKAETDANGKVQKDKYKYGVVSLDNKNIIGTKYDNIKFTEVTQEFFVTSSKKVGILSNEGAQKIDLNYDELKLLDNELRLYYVRNGDMKGVLDKNGKRIVYIEYNQIGIDQSKFPSNEITNGKLLFDNCIPVMKNNKWGLFDINGNQLLDTVYDSIGYIAGTKKDTVENNLAIIPQVEGIVICKDGKYGIINSTGKFIAPCSFDKIYSITNLGTDTYYLTVGTQTITLDEYQKRVAETQSTTQPENITQNTENQSTDTTQTTETNQATDDTTTEASQIQ